MGEPEPQEVSSVQVTLNFKVWSAVRGVPCRGRCWSQPTAVQENSEGLTWDRCLQGLKMIDFVSKFPSWPREAVLADNRVILVFLRPCSFILYQRSSRGFRYSQGVPDCPSSLLSFKGKKNGQQCQLPALEVEARVQCWLVLGLPGGGGCGGCCTTTNPRTRSRCHMLAEEKHEVSLPSVLTFALQIIFIQMHTNSTFYVKFLLTCLVQMSGLVGCSFLDVPRTFPKHYDPVCFLPFFSSRGISSESSRTTVSSSHVSLGFFRAASDPLETAASSRSLKQLLL